MGQYSGFVIFRTTESHRKTRWILTPPLAKLKALSGHLLGSLSPVSFRAPRSLATAIIYKQKIVMKLVQQMMIVEAHP